MVPVVIKVAKVMTSRTFKQMNGDKDCLLKVVMGPGVRFQMQLAFGWYLMLIFAGGLGGGIRPAVGGFVGGGTPQK